MSRSPRYEVPKAAPDPLRTVQRFVNTVDVGRRLDWLDGGWLVEEGLLGVGVSADEDDLRRAVAVREGLRALLVRNNGGALDAGAVSDLNRAVGSVRLGVRFAEDGCARLESPEDGIDAVLGGLLGLAYQAMVDGTWSRLKACRRCRWAFYDYSKNRSATWCSMKICGNRTKTRAYRRRRTSTGPASTP